MEKYLEALLMTTSYAKTYNVDGVAMTAMEVAVKFNISIDALRSRIKRNPNTPIVELLYKTGSRARASLKHKHNGKEKTVEQWALIYNMPIYRVRQRFKDGISLDEPIVEKRKVKQGESNWNAAMPKYDKDQELNQRIESYRKIGLKDDEIYNRMTKGDFTLMRRKANER